MADLTELRKQSRNQVKRANTKVAPIASDARDWAAPKVEASRDWAAPKVEAARDWAGPQVGAAKDWAAPRVEPVVETFKDDVLPKVAGAVAAALAASEPAREEAAKRGTAAVAALRGEVDPPRSSHKLRNFLLFFGVIGAAVAGWKAWTAQGKDTRPEPWVAAPTAASGPVTSAPVVADDSAGASPDEAVADAADVTVVEVADVPPTTGTPTVEPVSDAQAAKVDEATESGRAH